MKLHSIRLHPFGAIIDRTYSLVSGAQSLLGDNEFGKSTFRESLRHALFTQTDLTPGAESKEIGPWFPLPNGRSTSITLKFEHAGTTYCLEKCWGGGKRSSLKNEQTGEVVVDPELVQTQLAAMRGHSLATYERIFVASQAQMTDSIDELRKDGDAAVNQAALIASGIVRIAGDVDLESLTTKLTDSVTERYGRWDKEKCTPEMSRAGQGGLEKPWEKGVGAVLKSWYEWKSAELSVNQREQYEKERDRLNAIRSEARELISELAPDIDGDSAKTDGLYKRETLAARVAQLIGELEKKKKKLDDWRQKEAELNGVPERLQEYSDRLAELKLEKSFADQAARAVATRQQIARIRAAQSALDTAVRQADECKNVTQDQGESAATIKQNLHKCEVRIEAQRLTVELSTTRKMQIEAVSGASSPEQIDLEANQPWTFDALGKVGIKFEGMTVAVKSGLGEIDKLLADHAIAKGNRDELLRDTMCKDLDEVCQSRINRNVAKSKVTDAKTKLETELAGRTISDWDDDEQTISNIPSTRPLATVDGALNEIHVKEQVLITKRSEHENFIKEMKDKWPDQQTLDDEIAGDRTNLKTDQDNLTNCPTFPDGFTTASAFAADIKMRERKVEENRIKVEEANVGIAALGEPGDDDLESLRNTAEEERAKHKKELETAKQYSRIIDAINHIRGNADPFAAIADRITQLFNRLTNGRYGALSTASGLPTALRRDDGAELPSTRLSQGTAALLAIAVRIALAEQLLKEAPMFVLMDDPFVDLDATRRKLAAQVLQELGERTQVIVLTCHEEHANELGPLRVCFTPH